MDVLGPGPLPSGTTVAAALGPDGGPMLQAQSMLLSLWAHEDLIERGVLPAEGGRAIYPALVTTALRFMLHRPQVLAGARLRVESPAEGSRDPARRAIHLLRSAG